MGNKFNMHDEVTCRAVNMTYDVTMEIISDVVDLCCVQLSCSLVATTNNGIELFRLDDVITLRSDEFTMSVLSPDRFFVTGEKVNGDEERCTCVVGNTTYDISITDKVITIRNSDNGLVMTLIR